MAMTASEMIDLFRDQAEMSWAGVEAAKHSGNYDLAAFNCTAAFDARLMTGLIQWRLGVSPRESFARACDVVDGGLRVLVGLRSDASHWRSFDFSRAGFLGLLLDRSLPEGFDPPLTEWRSCGVDYLGQFLDRALVVAIRRGVAAPEWEPMIASLNENKRLRLLRDTYSVYMEVLTRYVSGDSDHAFRAAARAASLFKKRESDGYFAGGRGTDGGGPDNDHVVDFRLATLIRELPNAGTHLASTDQIHVWHG